MKTDDAVLDMGTRLKAKLQASELLGDLPASDLNEITEFCRWKNLSKDEVLFRRWQKSYGCFIVASGAFALTRMDAKGRECRLGVFRSGSSFAEATLSSGMVYPAEAKALVDSSVILIEREPFVRFIENHPALTLRILDCIGKRMRYLVGRWEGDRSLDARERLAEWLAARLPSTPHATAVIQLDGTKKNLANELGMNSETLSRCFTKLKEAGIISISGRKITVASISELRTLCRIQCLSRP